MQGKEPRDACLAHTDLELSWKAEDSDKVEK